MANQPKALRLADTFDHPLPPEWSDMQAAASELRRLHTENEALKRQSNELRQSCRARTQYSRLNLIERL